MASQYSQAITTSKETQESALRSQLSVATQAIRTGNRKIDIVTRFNDLARQGADKYKKWLQRGSLAAGIFAGVAGMTMLPAAAFVGGATYLAGRKGEKEAQKKFDKTDYLKDSSRKLMSQYEKKTQSSAVQNAVLAGISASQATKASKAEFMSDKSAMTEVAKKDLLKKVEPDLVSSSFSKSKGLGKGYEKFYGGEFTRGDILGQMYRNLGYHAKGWAGAFGENPFKAGSFISGKFSSGKADQYTSVNPNEKTVGNNATYDPALWYSQFATATNYDPDYE